MKGFIKGITTTTMFLLIGASVVQADELSSNTGSEVLGERSFTSSQNQTLGNLLVALQDNLERDRLLNNTLSSTNELLPNSVFGEGHRVNLASNDTMITKAENLLTTTMLLSEIADTLTNQLNSELERIRVEKDLAVEKLMMSTGSTSVTKADAGKVVELYNSAKKRYTEVFNETNDTLLAFKESAKIHNFEHYILTSKSGLTAEDIDTLLAGTALHGLGVDFIGAEEKWGVNAYALMSLAALESNWGKSRLAQNKNNLFGYMAYDRDPYNSAKHFATKGDAIMTVAESLATNYLSADGKYNNGYTFKGVNVRYASDPNWHIKITGIMQRLIN